MDMLRTRFNAAVFAVTALMGAAAASGACFGYYCQDTIAEITITSDAVYIRLTNGMSGLTNCTPYETSWFTLAKTNPNYNAHYAALLAARASGETVTLRPVDSSSNCLLQYMAVP
jgi:hypothetical protein